MDRQIMDFNPKNLKKLQLIKRESHKGENGKVLVIGGSTLFHSASIWAAELLAHFVDLVFYYSPALINREILLKTKQNFKNGIVISYEELEDYIQEADVILLGPGMKRRENIELGLPAESVGIKNQELNKKENEDYEGKLTHKLTNKILVAYPKKKFVLDAGALQELKKKNINRNHILTPHRGEFNKLFPEHKNKTINLELFVEILKQYPATYLLKNQGLDYVFSVKSPRCPQKIIGGNEGLIKGGSGDLLAALVAAFYVKNDPILAAASASYVLKQAAQELYKQQGPYYTSTELLAQIPKTFWSQTNLVGSCG